MAEDTVKLRAIVPVWDGVGCGDQMVEHFGLGEGDTLDVPKTHAVHLLRKGGYVMANAPVFAPRFQAPTNVLLKFKGRSDEIDQGSFSAATQVGFNRYMTDPDTAKVLCESHGMEPIEDVDDLMQLRDPRDQAVTEAAGSIAALSERLAERDAQLSILTANATQQNEKITSLTELLMIKDARIAELEADLAAVTAPQPGPDKEQPAKAK